MNSLVARLINASGEEWPEPYTLPQRIYIQYEELRYQIHKRTDKLAQVIARHLPKDIKLHLLAQAASGAINWNASLGEQVIEPHKVTYPEMYRFIEVGRNDIREHAIVPPDDVVAMKQYIEHVVITTDEEDTFRHVHGWESLDES